MKRLFAVVLFVLFSASSPLQAETTYPNKLIRLIVPFPAGSETDEISRVIAQKLGAKLGQQIVVENRPGASGSLGSEQVAKAAPDGYTIGLITGSTHGVAAALGPLPYDPVKDFKPISMLGVSPYVLVACPCLMINTVDELVRDAKARPGKLSYGSAGPASMAYLAAALFAVQSRDRSDTRSLSKFGTVNGGFDDRADRHSIRDNRSEPREHPCRKIARARHYQQPAFPGAAGCSDHD